MDHNEISAAVENLLREAGNIGPELFINPNEKLVSEIGLDRLEVCKFIVDIENLFELVFTETEDAKMLDSTLNEIVELLVNKISNNTPTNEVYVIEELSDFSKIPLMRLGAALEDFNLFIRLHKALKIPAKKFVWHDDGKDNAYFGAFETNATKLVEAIENAKQ